MACSMVKHEYEHSWLPPSVSSWLPITGHQFRLRSDRSASIRPHSLEAYHNTQGAWEKMRPFVGSYCRGEITILEFQHCIRDMYGTNTSKSYLFSLGDGQRCSGGAGSWRKAAVAEIPGWRGAATSIASTLIHPATTPESFFDVFLERSSAKKPAWQNL